MSQHCSVPVQPTPQAERADVEEPNVHASMNQRKGEQVMIASKHLCFWRCLTAFVFRREMRTFIPIAAVRFATA